MQLFSGKTFDLSQVLKANIVFKKLDNTTSSYIWEKRSTPTSPKDKSFDDFFSHNADTTHLLYHTLESDTTNHPKYLSLKNPSHQAAGVQVHAFQLVNQVELKEGGISMDIWKREEHTI